MTRRWKALQCAGSDPVPRFGHAMVALAPVDQLPGRDPDPAATLPVGTWQVLPHGERSTVRCGLSWPC